MLGLRPVTRGFTLLELLIVMAIVAIVATLAAPSFNGVLERQRVRTVADMLRSSIDLARSEAVKRNTPITVSRVSDDWNKGWQVLAGAEVVYEAPAQPSAACDPACSRRRCAGKKYKTFCKDTDGRRGSARDGAPHCRSAAWSACRALAPRCTPKPPETA